MTNISLSVNGVTFTFQDGDVDVCKDNIVSNIENSMITGIGPMGAYNYDYEGSNKTIELSGILTLSDSDRTDTGTCKTILAQKKWLESLVSGIQKYIILTSQYSTQAVDTTNGATSPQQAHFTTMNCLVDSMSFEEHSGKPNELLFRMSFKIGQGINIIISYILLENGDFALLETEDYIIK